MELTAAAQALDQLLLHSMLYLYKLLCVSGSLRKTVLNALGLYTHYTHSHIKPHDFRRNLDL